MKGTAGRESEVRLERAAVETAPLVDEAEAGPEEDAVRDTDTDTTELADADGLTAASLQPLAWESEVAAEASSTRMREKPRVQGRVRERFEGFGGGTEG